MTKNIFQNFLDLDCCISKFGPFGEGDGFKPFNDHISVINYNQANF